MDIDISKKYYLKMTMAPRWCVWLIHVVKEGLKIETVSKGTSLLFLSSNEKCLTPTHSSKKKKEKKRMITEGNRKQAHTF